MREPVVGWVLAMLGVVAMHAIGLVFVQGWALDLGSPLLPSPRLASLLVVEGSMGVAVVALATRAWATRLPGDRLADALKGAPDRLWWAGGAVVASALAAGVHVVVLQGMPVTDDESAYRFMAQVLAGGDLTAASPEPRLFFDRAFMINDGRLYAQYFLGWPALMAPFAAVGVDGLANAFWLGITVPGLFLAARRMADEGGGDGALAGRIAVLLAVTSPMLVLAAATRMSHTSCVAALAWCLVAVLRSRDADSPWWVHAAVGLFFSVAFFVRPLSAVGAGAPLLVAWLMGRRRDRRVSPIAAFVGVSFVMGAAFLAVNEVQNGSPWVVSYQRMAEFTRENGFRFSHAHPDTDVAVVGFRNYGAIYASAVNAVGLVRLAWDLFGWPGALALVSVAGTTGARGLATASWVGFFVASAFQVEAGVDPFGPTHFAEAAPGMLLAGALGFERSHRVVRTWTTHGLPRALPLAFLLGSLTIPVLVHTPVRLAALGRLGREAAAPFQVVAGAGVSRGIVFAPRPITPGCVGAPTRTWVFWRPNNPPELDDAPIWWVNHVTVAEDRAFAGAHPDRPAYLLVWGEGCEGRLIPIGAPEADAVAPAEMVLPPLWSKP